LRQAGFQNPLAHALGVGGLAIVEGVEKRLGAEGRLTLDDLGRRGAERG
jgi:hypothetical protein